MSDKYKELKSLFISDSPSAIKESQQIICSVSNFDTFSDFYNYHLEHLHISTCQNEWSSPQMAIHCINCSKDPQSCFCLKCFINSNHQGHDYFIRPNSTGNCDCGDLSLWKQSGFCQEHQGLEDDAHPEDYLDEKLRTTLTDIVFKAAFSSLKHLLNDDGQNLSIIFQFIKSFLKFGDGFRRLISISLTEKANFEKLFYSIFDANLIFNQLFQKFCGLLINDQLFKNNFSKVNFKLMLEKIIPISLESLNTLTSSKPIEAWKSFWFHSYQASQFKYNIEKNGWDWVQFALQLLTYTKEMYSFIDNPNYNNDYPSFLSSAMNIYEASNIQPNEQTQQLFDQIYSQILTCGTKQGIEKGINDTVIVTSFIDPLQPDRFIPIYYFNFIFYEILKSFKSKKNLKFDKMFEELDKTIDISQIFFIGKNVIETQKDDQNENDQFISQFIQNGKIESEIENNLNYFKSFHNGASFFISHPMYYTLAYLMRADNICRVKIAKFLSMKKYKALRIKLGIITLKSVLSLVCTSQSLISRKNISAYQHLSEYVNNPLLVDFGIPLLFPLFQLLIGIQSNEKEFELKEFFAFEMAREIGLFDDFDGENYNNENINSVQKQMIFSFLYVSILLIIERTLFNFDGYEFMKEQIIFGLKKGHSNLNELKDLFDKRVAQKGRYMNDLNEIISKVANARQRNNKGKRENDKNMNSSGNSDVSFDLKASVEFKNISAINSFNDEKVIMNNEISKHPENLLKIQNFEPEETYFFKQKNEEEIDSDGLSIKLKEFLMTPTVLAIVYHTLKTSHKEVELNDHLAMNILVLISKFIQEDDANSNSNSSNDEITAIKYNSTVVDLIAKLKAIVFNFKEKNSLQNAMTKKAFNSLLKMKIQSEDQEPKSFIDLLLDKGPVGKTVLDQMSIETELNEDASNLNQQEDINKKKKIRASKLKEDIINHFKFITSNFNANDVQNDELTPTSSVNDKDMKEVCSICSTDKKDEILSYPLYFYKTKLPFIVDKCPIIKMTQLEAFNEVEVFEDDCNETDNIDDEDDEFLNKELIRPDEMFAQILSNYPELDITSDLSEDEVQRRRLTVDMIQKAVIRKYEEMVQLKQQLLLEREEKLRKKEEREKEEIHRKEQMIKNPDMLVEKQCQPGNLYVIQFGICQHLVHPNCVKKEAFTCPIDRSFKNGFLPNIDDLNLPEIFEENQVNRKSSINSSNMSKQLKETLSLFIDKYSLFFTSFLSGKIVDLFVELVKSLSGLISTFEVRLRSLPDCLDSKKNKLLARNLFLTAWYSYRMKDKPKMITGFESNISEDVEKKLTVFQRFIKGLIECDTLEDSVDEMKNSLMNLTASLLKSFDENDDQNKFLFLRRVCLAEHFLLMNINENQNNQDDDSKVIDWDEVLSIECLSEKFNVQFSNKNVEFELRPFIFSKLPKEFLRFAQDPYNFPVDQTHKLILYNMLDYNERIKKFKNFEDDQNEFKSENESNKLYCSNGNGNANSFIHSNFSKRNSPSILLMIGSSASDIYVVDGKKIVFLRPFYLDRYGCTDLGFSRNQPLFLNEERYERMMDEILSGDFSGDLNDF